VFEGEFCETCRCENGGRCLEEHSKCQCSLSHEGILCEKRKKRKNLKVGPSVCYIEQIYYKLCTFWFEF
jgi:hypothetical protein